MKICYRCRVEKPIDQFYRHPAMASGRLNKCSECCKTEAIKYRKAKLEEHRRYDRERGLTPERRLKVRNNYKKMVADPEARARIWAHSIEWRRKNKEKRTAHIRAATAIKQGLLIKESCARCGATQCVHAHHEDYSRPLDVVWLCKLCHGERHREINEERRNKGESDVRIK